MITKEILQEIENIMEEEVHAGTFKCSGYYGAFNITYGELNSHPAHRKEVIKRQLKSNMVSSEYPTLLSLPFMAGLSEDNPINKIITIYAFGNVNGSYENVQGGYLDAEGFFHKT